MGGAPIYLLAWLSQNCMLILSAGNLKELYSLYALESRYTDWHYNWHMTINYWRASSRTIRPSSDRYMRKMSRLCLHLNVDWRW